LKILALKAPLVKGATLALILTLTVAPWVTSCATVHAQAQSIPLPLPPDSYARSFMHDMGTSPVACTPETFSIGSSNPTSIYSLVNETADSLEFSGSVCPLVVLSRSSYVTQYPHDVQEIEFELGSNTSAIQEYAAWAFFTWQDSQGAHVWWISQQRDQHVDDHNFHTERTIAKSFPAGTMVTIIRPAMNPAFCVNRSQLLAIGDDCQSGQQITLVGK
jgi:hypothetical protein